MHRDSLPLLSGGGFSVHGFLPHSLLCYNVAFTVYTSSVCLFVTHDRSTMPVLFPPGISKKGWGKYLRSCAERHTTFTTTSRERLINIFMSVFVYILTFIQKTGSKSKSSVLRDCSELDSEIILSECRIVGALEGTRLELGVRLVTLQLYTYWYNTAVQNFKNYRCWSVERRQVP